MRFPPAVGLCVFAMVGFAHGQLEKPKDSVFIFQTISHHHLPAISFTETQRCVKPGDNPATATTRFGSPGTGVKHEGLFTTTTTSYQYPYPGLYKEANFSVMGHAWKGISREMGYDNTQFFDGSTYFEAMSLPGQTQIYERSPDQAKYSRPTLINSFEAFPSEKLYSFVGETDDPNFGRVSHFKHNSLELDIANERGYMIVRRMGPGMEHRVLTATKIQGQWIPTEYKDSYRMGTVVDMYTSVSNLRPLPKDDQTFKPILKPGNVVMKIDKFFYVNKKGELVEFVPKKDHSLDVLKFSGLSVLFLAIVGTVIFAVNKALRPTSPPN